MQSQAYDVDYAVMILQSDMYIQCSRFRENKNVVSYKLRRCLLKAYERLVSCMLTCYGCRAHSPEHTGTDSVSGLRIFTHCDL